MEDYNFDDDDLIPREKVLFAFKGISLEGEYEGKPALLEVVFQEWGSPIPRATLRSYPNGIGKGAIVIEEIFGDFIQNQGWNDKINVLLNKMDGEENGFTGQTRALNGQPLNESLKLDFTFSPQGISMETKIGEQSYLVAYIGIFGIYGEDNDQRFQNAKLFFPSKEDGIPVTTWTESQKILAENSITVEFNSHTEPRYSGPQF